MPIGEEKLEEIPYNHRIRPYLLFSSIDGENYYAFAATSKNPCEYALENEYVVSGKSQIKLDECFIINISDLYNYNQVLDDGKIAPLDTLSNRAFQELVKKLKLNIDYDKNIYPSKVISKVKKEYNNLSFNCKDILFNGEKYIVNTEKNDNGYKVYDISFYAKSGYIEFLLNGNKCYINPDYYYIDSISDYDLSFVSNNLKDVLNSNMEEINRIDYTDDISSIDKMPIGSLMSVIYDEDEYIFIKVSEEEDYINFLVGRKGSYKRDYVMFNYKKGNDFNYEFYNVLSNEKLEFCLKKVNDGY